MEMNKLLILVFVLALASTPVFAEQQGDLDVSVIEQNTQESGGLLSFFDFSPEPLRVVSGGLCGDTANDAGRTTYDNFQVWCTNNDGTTKDLTGCVALFYDANWNNVGDKEIVPGKSVAGPIEAVYWSRYNCYEQEYSCNDYRDAGCGGSGNYQECAEDKMLRVRTCVGAPAGVETERCITDKQCSPSCTESRGAWQACSDGRQYRIITWSDCLTTKEYRACDSSSDTSEDDSSVSVTTSGGSQQTSGGSNESASTDSGFNRKMLPPIITILIGIGAIFAFMYTAPHLWPLGLVVAIIGLLWLLKILGIGG